MYVFRHGQTEFNRDKIFTGWLESKLTKKGIRQAKKINKLMKGLKIDLGIQTKLSRSKDTLKIVLKGHTEKTKIVTDNRMIERSYGKLSGKRHEDTIKEYGREQFNKWHRGWRVRPPGGESFADVEIRVKEFLKDLKKKYGGRQMNIAVSASGNSIRLLRKIMEKAKTKTACKWKIPYDQYFKYTI